MVPDIYSLDLVSVNSSSLGRSMWPIFDLLTSGKDLHHTIPQKTITLSIHPHNVVTFGWKKFRKSEFNTKLTMKPSISFFKCVLKYSDVSSTNHHTWHLSPNFFFNPLNFFPSLDLDVNFYLSQDPVLDLNFFSNLDLDPISCPRQLHSLIFH